MSSVASGYVRGITITRRFGLGQEIQPFMSQRLDAQYKPDTTTKLGAMKTRSQFVFGGGHGRRSRNRHMRCNSIMRSRHNTRSIRACNVNRGISEEIRTREERISGKRASLHSPRASCTPFKKMCNTNNNYERS
eukprot:2872869-Pyramimonas_sp.AAC.1